MLTAVVEMVKLAPLLPAGTVTLAGTVATPGLLLESDTITPPDGAAVVSVTVPCEELPPTTVDGFNDNDESARPGDTSCNAVSVDPWEGSDLCELRIDARAFEQRLEAHLVQ
ncbi:MAG TPA: hypothetical protein VG106_06905, partial [Vicinamibacterales bacterium]|nr:hypothetical protein [Vicinamibacterales bacterium]